MNPVRSLMFWVLREANRQKDRRIEAATSRKNTRLYLPLKRRNYSRHLISFTDQAGARRWCLPNHQAHSFCSTHLRRESRTISLLLHDRIPILRILRSLCQLQISKHESWAWDAKAVETVEANRPYSFNRGPGPSRALWGPQGVSKGPKPAQGGARP